MAGTDIVFGYNIRTYAPPPHSNIVAGEAAFISYHLGDAPAEIITAYMRRRAPNTPLTGEMFVSARDKYGLNQKGLFLMLALAQQDSLFGVKGRAVETRNCGNIGNDDEGHTRTYATWDDSVDAIAEWLSRHRVPA
jgi:hypothetical protein